MSEHQNDDGAAPQESQPSAYERGQDGVPMRPARFLIAALHPADPAEPGGLWDALGQLPGARLVRRISPVAARPADAVHGGTVQGGTGQGGPVQGGPGGPPTMPLAAPMFPEIAVVEMPIGEAAIVAQWPGVLVEPDLALAFDPPPAWGAGLSQPDPGLFVPLREPVLLRLEVQDTDGRPVPGSLVTVAGSAATAHGVTGPEGGVTVMLVADTAETVRSIVVRPAAGYWGVRLDAPRLTSDGPNQIVLRGLGTNGEAFGRKQHTGWGLSALRVSDLPPTYRGHRVKIALVDSGISTSHPELKSRVVDGRDVLNGSDGSWDEDATGHGTWCAGIIAGEQDGAGIAGIAADAELHSLKLFPGGYTSDLISALDYCIESEIDLAQLNLTTGVVSQLATWKLHEAHARGVACIAGAGDHGGPVAFPASAPPVLAVGAIGRAAQSPPGSIAAGYETSAHSPDGYFLPPFTAFSGPNGSVDLCAPGVAIPATAAPEGYTMADGTGIAAAHITGLAALVLAHHSDFRTTFSAHDGARVQHLFALLRASCTPVLLDDPRRTGTGLPDARRALSLTFETAPGWAQFARGAAM